MWAFSNYISASQYQTMSSKKSLQLLPSELGASGVESGAVLSQKLLRFPLKFEVLAMGCAFRKIK